MNVPRFTKLVAVARVLVVRCEVVGLGETDEVPDVVDLATIVEELEVVGGLLVGNDGR